MTFLTGKYSPRRGSVMAPRPPDVPNQDHDYGGVGEEYQQFAEGGPVEQLPQLERDERGGDDGGQPFRPSFAHPQAYALDRKYRRVAQGHEAQRMDPRHTDAAEPRQELGDDLTFQSQGPRRSPGQQLGRKRGVVQPDFAVGQGHQQQHLHQLVKGDDAQDTKARLLRLRPIVAHGNLSLTRWRLKLQGAG